MLSRLERKGLSLVAMELRKIDGELADRHYAEHVEKAFYPPLREFITSGPLVALVAEGDQAIDVVRGADRRHRRARRGRRHDPRRPLPVQPGEPRARLGLSGVGGARDRPVVSRALTRRTRRQARGPGPRIGLAWAPVGGVMTRLDHAAVFYR